MVIPIRPALTLLAALLLMAAGSDQLFAQGTGPGGAAEQPPPGSQIMPTDDPAAGDSMSDFPRGNVPISTADNKVGEEAAWWARLKFWTPYALMIIVIVIVIVVYLRKNSSGSSEGPSHEGDGSDGNEGNGGDGGV